ncbi:regulator [Pedobacter ginsenosidimutans]|uniref:Regulator n=1 Tax=Pedobacter ginsenosidimutans TaxID=687842 RepID=A0A0T5VVH8_9SPHI|nr:helix-turn-helix transcriptional regulator [Pedobacter ginsenosidimutans]KRT17808.1 regulator [Pedobacter ginsenosidimutans]
MNKQIIKYSFRLLNVDYAKLNHRWNFENVISPYYRIYYIDEGSGFITGLNHSLKLLPGYLYLIPSFTICNLYCSSYLRQYFVQFFEDTADGTSLFATSRKCMQVQATAADIATFKRLIEINPGRGINRSTDPSVYEKDIYYKEYTDLNDHQTLARNYENQGIIFQLISRFLEHASFEKEKLMHAPSPVMDSVSYININLGSKIKVSQLAGMVNLNPDYFARLFHRHTGLSPVNYILQKRIERAQYLLITTQKKQDEIATLTGFLSTQYFAKVFKKMTCHTPGGYKALNRTVNSGD